MLGFLDHRRGRIALVCSTALTCVLCSLIPAAPALAFNCGYGPCTNTAGSAAGFTSIVAAITFTSSGGTFSGSAHGATATVTVPRGSLPKGGEVVIGAGTKSSIRTGNDSTLVAGFSVDILNPDTGAKLKGPFNPAITLKITDPDIAPGDTVVFVTSPGHIKTASGAQVTQGQAVVKFTSDPNVAVLKAKSTGAFIPPVINAAQLALSSVFSGQRGLIANPGKKFSGAKLVVRVDGKFLSFVVVTRNGRAATDHLCEEVSKGRHRDPVQGHRDALAYAGHLVSLLGRRSSAYARASPRCDDPLVVTDSSDRSVPAADTA